MTSEAVFEALSRRAPELNRRAVDRIYEDPFWMERFGPRGRRFAEEDGRHHLGYLEQALTAGDIGIMVHYARWLQSVLTSRGMCSRHLAEHFRRLAEEIAAENVPGAELAARHLGAAEDALHYRSGAAEELDAAASAIAEDARARLEATGERDWWGPRGRATALEDLARHVSYLVDAVALERPELFAGYCRFIGPFLERHGAPRGTMRAALEAVAGAVRETRALSAAAVSRAAEVIDAGRGALLAGDGDAPA